MPLKSISKPTSPHHPSQHNLTKRPTNVPQRPTSVPQASHKRLTSPPPQKTSHKRPTSVPQASHKTSHKRLTSVSQTSHKRPTSVSQASHKASLWPDFRKKYRNLVIMELCRRAGESRRVDDVRRWHHPHQSFLLPIAADPGRVHLEDPEINLFKSSVELRE